MGAKGSKPTSQQPSTNTLPTPRNNIRKNIRTNTRKYTAPNRRNNTRANKQPAVMPPTFSSPSEMLDCSTYPPPDPEQKVPRRNVPYKCLLQWEVDIFSADAMARSRAQAAAPKPPLPLDRTTITWAKLLETAAAQPETWKPILLFQTPTREEYAIVHTNAIQDRTHNGKTIYPLRRFFNKYKDELKGFCNYVYDSSVTNDHIEDGMTPYLILHRVITEAGETIEVVGFMTMTYHEEELYIGDICIGPKRGGIGRLTLERIKTFARKWDMETVKLEPASNTEPFYEKLGFKQSPNNNRHHEWHPKNGGRRTVKGRSNS
jgi:hypothetical protein